MKTCKDFGIDICYFCRETNLFNCAVQSYKGNMHGGAKKYLIRALTWKYQDNIRWKYLIVATNEYYPEYKDWLEKMLLLK
jgi:hypothetical protein